MKSEMIIVKSEKCWIKFFLNKKFLAVAVIVGVLSSVVFSRFFVSFADAATVNNQINFQGKLVNPDGTNVADSTYTVVFSLYNVSSAGTAIWTETDSVTTSGGAFQVALGAVTSLSTVDFTNSNLYLGIKVGTDAEMTPRIRFSAVPYAFNAASLDGVVATESATGFNLQGGTSSLSTLAVTTSGGALTFQPGVAEGLTLQSNGANGLTLDTGGNGAVNIGNTNATSLVFGNSGHNPTLTLNGTGLTTLGGGLTVNGQITASNYTNNTGILYTDGTGLIKQTGAGSDTNCLVMSGTTPQWGSCIIGGGQDLAQTVSSLTTTTLAATSTLLGTVSITPTTTTGDIWVQANMWTNSLSNTNQTLTWELHSGSTCAGTLLTSSTSNLTSASASDGPAGFLSYITDNAGTSAQQFAICAKSSTASGASAGGVAYATVIDNTGPQGPQGPTGASDWQYTGPVLSPNNLTMDLTLGGLSTSSAKFAVLNMNSGTPTASISAQGGTNSALVLGGDSSIQSVQEQLLTFGGDTTGSIQFKPGNSATSLYLSANGTAGIGTTTPLATFDVRANSGTSAITSLSGSTSFAGLVVNNSGAGDLIAASKSGATKFVINSQGNVGINTTIPLAALDVRGTSGTTPVASVAGATSFASLVVNNSGNGDLVTASSSGITRFRMTNNGSVVFQGDSITSIGTGGTNTTSGAVENHLGDTGSLIPNPGFDSALTGVGFADGWAVAATNSAAVTRDTTVQAKGIASAKVTFSGASQSTAVYSTCIPLALQSGTGSYTLNYYAKPSIANRVTVRAYIDAYTSKGNCEANTTPTFSAAQGGNLTTTNWATTGSGATAITFASGTNTWGRVHIFVGCPASCSGTTTVNLDGVRLVQSANSSGLDYAEEYPADPNNTPKPGQVASIEALGDAVVVVPASKYMDQSAIGVVSTNPGNVLDDGAITNPVPVALAGRVPVNVSTVNGPIHIGDYLTSSSIPGVAVKAINAGPIIGTAMSEDTDSNMSDISQVTMFIKNSYYNGGTETATNGLNVLSGMQDPSVLLTMLQGVQTASCSALTSLTSGQVAEGLTYIASVLGTATQSASLTEQRTMTPSVIGGIVASTISGLTVNGSATISADLHVKGDSLVEGVLHVADTLFANNLIANGISDFFGNVIFHSGVTFNDAPVFDSDTAGFAVIKKGSDHVVVTFSKSYDHTPIINASITLNPITPTPSETLSQQQTRESQLEEEALQNIHYIIINRTTKGFTILLQQPADEDISFSWVALAVNSPMIFQSDGQHMQLPIPSESVSPSPIDSLIPTSIPVSPTVTPTDDITLTPTPGG